MQRRGFLKMIGLGAPVVAAASSFGLSDLLLKPIPMAPPFEITDIYSVPPTVDPMGQWVSYKFHMTVSARPDRTQRIRYIG